VLVILATVWFRYQMVLSKMASITVVKPAPTNTLMEKVADIQAVIAMPKALLAKLTYVRFTC
jgi:hypothetical protein